MHRDERVTFRGVSNASAILHRICGPQTRFIIFTSSLQFSDQGSRFSHYIDTGFRLCAGFLRAGHVRTDHLTLPRCRSSRWLGNHPKAASDILDSQGVCRRSPVPLGDQRFGSFSCLWAEVRCSEADDDKLTQSENVVPFESALPIWWIGKSENMLRGGWSNDSSEIKEMYLYCSISDGPRRCLFIHSEYDGSYPL
jgi:hypothetical protein